MNGVSWDERSETDWLASNGRWYPRSNYPARWSMTSLPPAPGHGQADSILRRATSPVPSRAESGAAQTQRPTSGPLGGTWSKPETPKGVAEARTAESSAAGAAAGRSTQRSASDSSSADPRADASDRTFLPKEQRRTTGPADAKVVGQRTYKPKVAPGPPPPSALPPPPGRVRDDAPSAPAPPDSPLPPPPVLRKSPPPRQQTDLEVVAGDLGKVLGVAKRRISRAINEAAEQGR